MLNLLQLGLAACVVLFSIVNVFKYMGRRGDSKQAFRDLRAEGTPIRQLRAEEQEALKPFLAGRDAGIDVYALSGAFLRHGLETSQGVPAKMHDTLGGVDVMLPYDARDFLDSNNTAEVVLLDKAAVVIALNGGFDLVGGRERSLRLQQRQRQWAAGKPGEMQDIYAGTQAGEGETAAVDEADGTAAGDQPTNHAEILGQRDESPAEVAARSGRGVGLIPSLLWILAFGAMAFAASDVFGSAWVAAAGVAGVCTALALWLFWRERRLPAAQRVNRVRGRLSEIALPKINNTAVVSRSFFIGDEFAVTIPAAWNFQAVVPDDAQVDVDMRVADRSVVRFGKTYSTDEDERRFPRIFWGRHLTVALVALCALLALWLIEGAGLSADLAITAAWVRGMQPQSYESAAALAAASPAWGSLLTLRGSGRCEVIDADGNTRLDCHHVRWDGDTPKSADKELDDDLAALYSGDFIDAVSNPMIDAMVQSEILQAQLNDPGHGDALSNMYARTIKYSLVPSVSAVIAAVRKVCETKDGNQAGWQSRCDGVESDIAAGLNLNTDESVKTWAALIKLADEGKLKGHDTAIVSSGDLEHIEVDARKLAALPISAALNESAQITLHSQRGGAVLQVLPGAHTLLPGMQQKPKQGGDQDPDQDEDQDEDQDGAQARKIDLLAQWHTYKALATPDSVRDFNVSGVVVGTGRDASGAPLFQVDASHSVDHPRVPALYSLWAVLALVLALLHASLFVLRYVAARRVYRERNAFYKQRAAPVIF